MKSALLKNENELVLALIERPAARLVLGPDAETDLLQTSLPRGIEHLVQVGPIRAQVMQRTRAAIKRKQRTDLYEEPRELARDRRRFINMTSTAYISEGLGEVHCALVFYPGTRADDARKVRRAISISALCSPGSLFSA
jgi:hypothetical protein